MTTAEQHLTTKELARRWGCSTGHLANQRTEGTGLPFIKFPGRVLYRLADVLTYEDAHTVEPVSA